MGNDTRNTDSPHWQTVEPSGLPLDYDPTFNDEERIEFLENKCIAMTKVVDAAVTFARELRMRSDWWPEEAALEYVVRQYQEELAGLVKGDGR